jgi:hypothetical protein
MQKYPDHPWSIRRNGKECARSSTRREADRIIRQLQKIHRTAKFTVQYEGANISHCAEGGKAL